MIWDVGLQILVLKKWTVKNLIVELVNGVRKLFVLAVIIIENGFKSKYCWRGVFWGDMQRAVFYVYHAIKTASLFKITEMFDSFGSISLYVFDVSGVFFSFWGQIEKKTSIVVCALSYSKTTVYRGLVIKYIKIISCIFS